jgi:hypothetical protein
MSLKSKNVISNFTGNSVTIKDQQKFDRLDSLLSSIGVPEYALLGTLNILINSGQSTNLSTLESFLSLLPLSQIDAEIQQVYGLTGLNDALCIANGNYFLSNTTSNQLNKNNLSSYAFSFFEVNTDSQTTISINDSKFLSFIQNYLPKLNEFVAISDNSQIFINLLKTLFIYSLNKIIVKNTNINYCVYETNLREKKNENNNSYFYDVKPQYNFYLRNYENVFNDNFSYINMIPNYYAVNSYLIDNNQNVESHLSLGRRIPLTKKTVSSQEYFTNFSNLVKVSSSDDSFLNTYSSIFNNVLLDSTSYSTNQISTENFPYVNKFTFFNDTNPISTFLTDNDLELLTLNNCYSSLYGIASTTTLFSVQTTDVEQVEDTIGQFISVNGIRYNNTYTNKLETKTTQTANFNQIFNFLSNSPYGFEVKNNNAFKFDNNFSKLEGAKNLFRFAKLNNLFFDLYKEFNNYSYVKNLQSLRVDTVCYFIEKSLNTNSVLQTVGLTAEQSNEIVYKDTQVAYNKNVIYNVFTVDSIPTINLSYQKTLNYYTQIKLDVVTKIEQRFYKNLMFTTETKITDSAPVLPSITFVPYRNINSIVTILFNSTNATLREYPITILSDDINKFVDLQKKEIEQDGKIVFQSDDSVDRVQIFRTTTKPTSYSDFSNSLFEEVSFNNLSAASYLMNVEPNIKYYLTFRSIDVHGLLSNPTEVFELESISNSGANYFVINTINLFNNQDFNFNKDLRKYLSISPSFDYSQINLLDNSQVKFGNDNKLWGQKFKIRVTSKKSGKSFDLNIKYVKNEIDLT